MLLFFLKKNYLSKVALLRVEQFHFLHFSSHSFIWVEKKKQNVVYLRWKMWYFSQNIYVLCAIAANWTTFDCVNLIISRASFLRSDQPLFLLSKYTLQISCTLLIILLLGIIQKKNNIFKMYCMLRLILLLRSCWIHLDEHFNKSVKNLHTDFVRSTDSRKFVCILIRNANCWQTFHPFGVHLRILLLQWYEKRRRRK